MTDFKELREALDAGVTGASESHDSIWMKVGSTVMLNSGRPVWARIARCEHEPNANYIAAANPSTIRSLLAELDAARRDAEAKQARIDALMLEHCPDEMTDEQVASWGDAQVAAKHNPAIDAAMKDQQP